MRAALINLPVSDLENDSIQPPIGLVSIATSCSGNGFDIEVCDLSGVREERLDCCIPESDVYGFSTYSVTYEIARKLSQELRRLNPNALFVAGGPHASALPEQVKKDFDCVVIGEGEKAFSRILTLFAEGKRNSIPPVIKAEPIDDLDELPFPDFYRFCDLKKYSRSIGGIPAMTIDTSRGCNFRCKFCNSTVMSRGKWRARSSNSVFREILWHYSKGWRAFRFNDDNFLADPDRAIDICEMIAPLNIKFRLFARAESLSLSLCKRLKEAGCEHISVGVESLSEIMLSRMGKRSCVKKIKDGLKSAREAGISTRGFFICGFPGETEETLNESLESLNDVALSEAIVYPCIPYPGTPLFRHRNKYGITWINENYSEYLQVGIGRKTGYVMNTKDFGPKKVEEWRNRYIHKFEELGIGWAGHGVIK